MLSKEALFATPMQVRPHRRRRIRRRTGRRAGGRPAQRSLAWVLVCLVALLLGGRVASVGHMVLTRHVQCPHGELVHVVHDESPKPATVAQPDVDGVAVHAGYPPAGPHEHCNPPALFDVVTEHARPAMASQLIEWQLLSRTVGPAVSQQAIAILSLAPKSSPPRA